MGHRQAVSPVPGSLSAPLSPGSGCPHFLPGEGNCLPGLSAFLPKELPRLGYFILHCPIQKSFQRLQPCQRRACTKGLFDFLFVFICQRRGEGAGEKELLGFKIFIWVVSFWELAPCYSCLSQGPVAGQRVPEATGVGVGLTTFIPLLRGCSRRLGSRMGRLMLKTVSGVLKDPKCLTVNDLSLFTVSSEDWSGPQFHHFLLGSLD